MTRKLQYIFGIGVIQGAKRWLKLFLNIVEEHDLDNICQKIKIIGGCTSYFHFYVKMNFLCINENKKNNLQWSLILTNVI